MKADIYKVEETIDDFGTIKWWINIECKSKPKFKLGECEITQ